MKNYFTAAFTAFTASICLMAQSVCVLPLSPSAGLGAFQPSFVCFWAQFVPSLPLPLDFNLRFQSFLFSLFNTYPAVMPARLSTSGASWEYWLIFVEGSMPALREQSPPNPLQACQVKQGMQQGAGARKGQSGGRRGARGGRMHSTLLTCAAIAGTAA